MVVVLLELLMGQYDPGSSFNLTTITVTKLVV